MKYEKYECDGDCFNCKWPDCIKDKMSKQERQEIKRRDELMDAGRTNFRGIVRHKKRIKR